MNRGLVNLEELRTNINKADFKGKSGFCFIKGNKLIKVYARKEDKGLFNPVDPSKICDFSKFKADTIVYPEEYIPENGKKAGEISNYLDSLPVYEALTGKEKIDFIIDSYEKVVSDLDLYRDIDMIDLEYVNILYSEKNGLNIIDTTDWQFRDNSFKRNLYNLNKSLTKVMICYNLGEHIINYEIIGNILINDNLYHNLDKFGKNGVRLKRILDLVNNEKYYFLEYLFAYMEIYEHFYGTNMKMLEDMQEMTKVIKKG